ncbi:signal recognition particle-docking protein FtsY [Oleispirillum naphthae]|uniref:signal recognition particle-docking protein FtsY n=1 Tax=Oleispirillum naphthae TaxID=2838853 RepID=UPI00308253C8
MSGQTQDSSGWLARLRAGLARSSARLGQGIGALITRRTLDDAALEELEDLLITADIGVTTSARLVAALREARFGRDVTADEVRAALAEEIEAILDPVAKPLVFDPARKPHVVLVVGVNGAGKTTTIGKIAKQLKDQGLGVVLAAGDTFRAAAVEQLQVWGQRTGCPVMARETGADAAGVAFDALKLAAARKDDVLLIDTAGRLHNRTELMAELEKISRVLKKLVPDAPHSTLLVLDATTGQNAHQQVDIFSRMVHVDGLAMTKLDGTAKGGVVVSLAEKYKIPVHYAGVGESAEDLRPFSARDYARGLLGLPPEG